jgi:site-specific DNA-methyltransferase (adenine-specific)
MKARGKAFVTAGRGERADIQDENGKAMPDHEPVTDAAKQWQGWGTALKPSNERWVLVRKPLDKHQSFWYESHKVGIQVCQLLSGALHVNENLRSSLSECEGALNTVQWSVESAINTLGDLCVQMDTSLSGLERDSCSNIVSLWLRLLGEIYLSGNTYTTEMVSSLTTDLKTLRCLLSKNTQGATVLKKTQPNGEQFDACSAESLLKSALLKLSYTHVIDVQSDAMGLTPHADDIILIRKPCSEKTVAANVLKWGTGALNIDASRIEGEANRPTGLKKDGSRSQKVGNEGWDRPWKNDERANRVVGDGEGHTNLGRFPANLVLTEGEAVEMLDEQSGVSKSTGGKTGKLGYHGADGSNPGTSAGGLGDSGGASRFFYCAKISKAERNAGLDSHEQIAIDGSCREENTVAVQLLQKVTSGLMGKWSIAECGSKLVVQFPKGSKSTTETEISKITESKILNYLMRSLTKGYTPGASKHADAGSSHAANAEKLKAWLLSITKGSTELALGASRVASETLQKISASDAKPCVNFHSTVKPKRLMSYLIRMVTPPGGVVLDPFMGSGSTGVAAKECGFEFIGIEKEPEYFNIAKARVGCKK